MNGMTTSIGLSRDLNDHGSWSVCFLGDRMERSSRIKSMMW